MRRSTCWCVVLLFLGSVAHAQQPQAEPAPAEVPEYEQAIRGAIESYVAAFHARDAQRLAAHWSEDGEFLTPSGKELKGREEITRQFETYFSEVENSKLEITESVLSPVSPSVVIERGAARLTEGDDPPVLTTYEAVHVKQGGKWVMDSVRETEVVQPSTHYEHLQPLAWLAGTWVDDDEETAIETTFQWSRNRNFLMRHFRVYEGGELTREGTQVIGWDPEKEQIRSWMFDSEGAFGTGEWSQRDNGWVIKSSQVLADGSRATSINSIEPLDDNRFTWRSTQRQVGGELLPSLGPVTVQRVE